MSHFQAEDLRAMFSFPSAKAMSQIVLLQQPRSQRRDVEHSSLLAVVGREDE